MVIENVGFGAAVRIGFSIYLQGIDRDLIFTHTFDVLPEFLSTFIMRV